MGVLTNVPDIPRNITNVDKFYTYVVGVTPSFFVWILVALDVIIFTRMLVYGASRAMIVANFITGVLAIAIAVIGWMDIKWTYLFGVLLALGVLWRSFESGETSF